METGTTRGSTRRALPTFTVGLGVIVMLGFALRMVELLAGKGGLGESVHPGYDESVYVGAAWLARDGLLPYRDFVFVFPPGFLLLLWPVTQVAALFGGPALAVTLVRVLAAAAGALNIWLLGRIGFRWTGPVGGIIAAVVYATATIVVQTEAVALQEPFVNLAVLLAVSLWAQRPGAAGATNRLVAAGLLVGVAISVKLVAGVFLVPLLIAGPFARPVADRVRLVIAASIPLAVTAAAFAVVVGWRRVLDQVVLAQVLRPRDGAGISRVDSMLPLLRGQVRFTSFLAVPTAWLAVAIFGAACVAAIWKGGSSGRLWGSSGLVFGAVLMASPSYFDHYGVLLAPTVALVGAWTLTTVAASLTSRAVISTTVATATLLVVVLVIGALQTATTVDALPVRLGHLGSELGTIVNDRGRPAAGRVSKGIRRSADGTCIFAVRPQPLIDANRVPPTDRDGRALLDVYGSALVAALDERREPVEMENAAFPSVQADILAQSRDCEFTVLSLRKCRTGRKDLTAATERRLLDETRPFAAEDCLVLRRRVLVGRQGLEP